MLNSFATAARFAAEGVIAAARPGAAGRSDREFGGDRVVAQYGNLASGDVAAIGDFNGDDLIEVVVRTAAGDVTGAGDIASGIATSFGNRAGEELLAVADFDGDGEDDLLFRDNASGTTTVTGGDAQETMSFTAAQAGARKGIGDFDGDGKLDLIVEDETGVLASFAGDGSGQIGNYKNVSDWELMGAGDFDGDGDDEVLVQRISIGRLVAKNGDGTVQQAITDIPDGKLLGLGDFDGDGVLDLIVERDTGLLVSVAGDGSGIISKYGMADTWRFLEVADFDGDGGDDVLLQRISSGMVIVKDGEGGLQDRIVELPDGEFEGVGDFDGDGNPDIVVQRGDGMLVSKGGTGSGTISKYGNANSVDLLAIGDFDGDGTDDLLLQKYSDGFTYAKTRKVPDEQPENNAPVLVTALSDQVATGGDAVSFAVPADAFDDADGDVLTFAATLADGSPLPDWLVFDAVTLGFTGSTPNEDAVLDIRISVSDGEATVHDDFLLTVEKEGSSAGFGFDSVNSWFDPATGGGYSVTFEYAVQADAIVGGELKAWDLEVGYDGPGTITGGWLGGFPGGYAFEIVDGGAVFSTVGEGYQPDLSEATTFTISLQVDGAGYTDGEYAFTIFDRDPLPVFANAENALVLVDPTNDWGSGLTQNVSLSNVGLDAIDDWSLVLDVPDGIGSFEITNVWGAIATELENGDIRFDPLGWNEAIGVGGEADFGFNASYSGLDALAFAAGNFGFA